MPDPALEPGSHRGRCTYPATTPRRPYPFPWSGRSRADYTLRGNSLTIVITDSLGPYTTFTLHYDPTVPAMYGPVKDIQLPEGAVKGHYEGNLKCDSFPASE